MARALPGHEVESVQKNGWAGIRNGELLARAEKEFDVFVTLDGNMQFQQNYAAGTGHRRIARPQQPAGRHGTADAKAAGNPANARTGNADGSRMNFKCDVRWRLLSAAAFAIWRPLTLS